MQIYDGKKREIKRKSDKRKSLCILIFEQITLTREGVFKLYKKSGDMSVICF